MNRPDDHVVFEELAAGHALSALEPEEEHLFGAHLAVCTRCQRDVAEHQTTLELMAYAADPADPPPSVLEGIRAGLPPHDASPLRPPASPGAPVGPDAPVGLGAPVGAASEAASVTSLSHARWRRGGRGGSPAQWVGAAAAAALVLGLGAWNLTLRADQEDAESYSDRLAVAVRELASPDSRDVALTAEDGSVVAVAVVRERDVSVVVDGLAPNRDDTTYVLWAQDGTGAVSAVGAFDVEAPEVDVVTGLGVDVHPSDVTAFLVSEEQGQRAPEQPGGPVLASGEI